MNRLALPLMVTCLLALALTPASTPAQQAAPAATPLLLSQAELDLWHAWIKGDHATCYARAQDLLTNPGALDDPTVSAALQARCADELGWHQAHARDLQAALESAGNWPVLRWHRMQRLKRLGNLAGVRAESRNLRMLTRWWIAGPFGNERGQGFEDVLEPENDFGPDTVYAGKDGQSVTWREVPAARPDGTIHVGAMLRPNKEAVAYLMTAVHVDQDTQVELHVASDCPIKVWQPYRFGRTESGEKLDPPSRAGICVLEADVERPCLFDQNSELVPLAKGWNLLLVKVGNSDAEWLVSVRLGDGSVPRQPADTEELRRIHQAMVPSPWNRDLAEDPDQPEPSPLHDALSELLHPVRDRVTAFPRMTMAAVLADYEALYAAAPESAREALKPERAVLYYMAAWANRSASSVAAGREENHRRELLKQCFALEPAAARAALELAQYYTGTFANPALADEYAARAARLAPGWVEARVFAARVLQMKGLTVEVERELALLMKEQPEHPQVLRFAAYYAGLREDYSASNRLFEKALVADHNDSYARDRLIDRAVARGELAMAESLAAHARALDPLDIRCAAQLAELHTSQGRTADALREVDAALAIAPRDDDLLARAGEILALMAAAATGDKAAGLNAQSLARFREALEANPNREDILRYIEFQDRERPLFEAALQQDITARIQAALKAPMTGDDPWQVVYRDQITVVNEDGTTSVYTQEARRVMNDDGRDALQGWRAPAWGGQQARCVDARVWRADGSIEEGRRSSYGASFSTLDIGDVVHARFRVSDTGQSFFGDFFGAREVMADYVPVAETRLVYVLPAGRDFFDYTAHGAPSRVVTESHGRRVWTYTAQGLAKVVDEPLAPPPDQRAPMVQISTYKSWQDFGRWYYNLIRKQLEPTPEMTAKVQQLTLGASTEKDKVRAIYNWVVTAVRYNADWHFGVHGYKPFSAGAVFARCIGDCKDKAILMCAMLGIAGIKAYPVIINLELFRGVEDISLPMPHHFNHAIAYVEYADGKGQFLDGTTTYNGIDELPAGDAGAQVIVVRPEGGVVMRVPVPEPLQDSMHDAIDAELLDNGSMRLKVRRTARGDSAAGLRASYQREGDRKRLLEREWAENFAGAQVSDISTSDLSDLDAPAAISFTVELPGAVTAVDGGRTFRLAPDPRQWGRTHYASLTARRTDLTLPPPRQRSSTWMVTLPAGMAIAALPARLDLSNPNARLLVSAEIEKGKLVIRRSYSLLGGTVKQGDYSRWRRDLLEFDRAESATIKLAPGEAK
ncbi:MAG: hypothetical protein KF754_09110 [Planctomycetes bacterium]|nr:hypothetical protein [Planctomycetota bacterium]